MKTLLATVAIVVIAGSFCFGVLALFRVPLEFSAALATVFFGAMPYLHQVLEKQLSGPGKSVLPQGVVTLHGFSLPWYLLLVYGAALTIAAMQYLGFVSGVMAGLYNLTLDPYVYTYIPDGGQTGAGWMNLAMNLFVLPVPIFLIGRWMGTRSENYRSGIGIALGVVGIAMVLDSFLLLIFTLPGLVSSTPTFGDVVLAMALVCFLRGAITVWMATFLLLGYWRGYRVRIQRYLGYLVSALPHDTQATLVNMAYEEAERLASQRQAAPTTPITQPIQNQA